MFLFAHVGLTAAAFRTGDVLFPATAKDDTETGFRSRISAFLNRVRSHTGNIDYRMVIIGSMLPDIIDKPLFLLLGDRFFSLTGRDYAHSLLFNLLLLAGGLFLTRYKKPWLLVVSIASFTHLLFDRIWEMPVTLLWPVLGPLTGEGTTGWLSERWYELFSSPGVYIPEIIGLIAVLYFAFIIARDKGIFRFIRSGNIG